jgi:hypothetical protein
VFLKMMFSNLTGKAGVGPPALQTWMKGMPSSTGLAQLIVVNAEADWKVTGSGPALLRMTPTLLTTRELTPKSTTVPAAISMSVGTVGLAGMLSIASWICWKVTEPDSNTA